MNPYLHKSTGLVITVAMILIFSGCEKAETTIIEKDSIISEHEEDEHDHDHDHDDAEKAHAGISAGRLMVLNSTETEAQVFDASENDLLATVSLSALPSAVYATAGYRFAALIERNEDKVSFIDAGLWQQAHEDHYDLVASVPLLLNDGLTGSRPTHFVPHEGQVALFLDGDSEVGSNAGVRVFSDHMIEDGDAPFILNLNLPQHGVAEPRGDHLFVSTRRDDAESTSDNFVLPDQVGLYHLHDGSYELERVFDVNCPNLHGAAQNEAHIVFACSDGLLMITDDGSEGYSVQKMENSNDMAEGLRIGSLWGHHESGQFIGQASAHGGEGVQFFFIDPSENEMELLDWQPMPNANPVVRSFDSEAKQFLILDDQGYLTVIEPHQEGGHTHWEYHTRLDITEADVITMPEGFKFSMALAQNSHTAYIADPMRQHILTVDLELLQITGELELDYAPMMITWLGIAEAYEH